jgi:hypothetical protein
MFWKTGNEKTSGFCNVFPRSTKWFVPFQRRKAGKAAASEKGYFKFLSDLFTIMTLKVEILFVHHTKYRRDFLVIGDAIGIDTPDDFGYFIRYFHRFFKYDSIILDHNNGCARRYQRYFVQFFAFKILVAYFDDPFLPVLPAVEISTGHYLVWNIIQIQNTNNLENAFRGNMIDHCAVFNGGDIKFGSFVLP